MAPITRRMKVSSVSVSTSGNPVTTVIAQDGQGARIAFNTPNATDFTPGKMINVVITQEA